MKKGRDAGIIENIDREVRRSVGLSGARSILVGISGGADSTCLLLSLLGCDVRLKCMHCNFHLRGEESMRDQRFVESLCGSLGIALAVVDFDVDGYRRENGGSVETACRDLRYAEFRRCMKEEGFDRIAVAHNSDDNAETMLLNLFRGTGLAGLRGMKTDSGEILRPLLGTDRSRIEEYLAAKGVDYITDSTNLEDDYRRNFIRNRVLPLVETRWPDVRKALNLTSRNLSSEEVALEEYEETFGAEDGTLEYSALRLTRKPEWIVRRFVTGRGGNNEIASEIARTLSSEEIQPGKRWITEEGEFVTGRHALEWLEGKALPEGSDVSDRFMIKLHENTPRLMAEIKNDRSNSRLWLPEGVGLRLRTRKAGDRIYPLGMKGSRLVSDVVGDAGSTARSRRDVVVAERLSDGEILWVEGLKRSRKELIGAENKIIIEIVRK